MFGLGALQKLPLVGRVAVCRWLDWSNVLAALGPGRVRRRPASADPVRRTDLVGAYLGVRGTGLAATAAAGLSSNYFLLESFRSLAIINPVHQVEWGFLWLIGIVGSLSAEGLIRSIRQGETGRGRMEAELAGRVAVPGGKPLPGPAGLGTRNCSELNRRRRESWCNGSVRSARECRSRYSAETDGGSERRQFKGNGRSAAATVSFRLCWFPSLIATTSTSTVAI